MLFIIILPIVTIAHPVGTDSLGCHKCRTNCSDWGLSSGEYHCHKSKGFTQPEIPISSRYGSNGTGYTEINYEYMNERITNFCPKNSFNFNGNCECYSGYVKKSGKCVNVFNDFKSTTKKYEYSCPLNSTVDKNNIEKCLCNDGYKTNIIENRCDKITKKIKNKIKTIETDNNYSDSIKQQITRLNDKINKLETMYQDLLIKKDKKTLSLSARDNVSILLTKIINELDSAKIDKTNISKLTENEMNVNNNKIYLELITNTNIKLEQKLKIYSNELIYL